MRTPDQYEVTYRGPAWRDGLTNLLRQPAALLHLPHTRVLNRTSRSTVLLVNGVVAPLIIKIFDESRPDRTLRGRITGSAGRRTARYIERLDAAGIAVPRLVAVLERRVGVFCVSSCVVTVAITDGVSAHTVWQQVRGAQRRGFARQVAAYVRRLHASGFYARDLQACNFIVLPSSDGWKLVLVDLDRVRRFRRVPWNRRRKNLVQIDRSFGRQANLREKVRFLTDYLGPVGRGELRRVAAELRTASLRKDAEWEERQRRAAVGRRWMTRNVS